MLSKWFSRKSPAQRFQEIKEDPYRKPYKALLSNMVSVSTANKKMRAEIALAKEEKEWGKFYSGVFPKSSKLVIFNTGKVQAKCTVCGEEFFGHGYDSAPQIIQNHYETTGHQIKGKVFHTFIIG